MPDIFDQIAGNTDTAAVMPQGDFFDQISGNSPNLSSAPPSAGYGDAAWSLAKEAPANIWGGIKKAPGMALDMITSIPSGVSNLAHLPGDALQVGADAAKLGYSELTGQPFTPTGTQEGSREVYGRIDRTLSGIGGIAATIAGGGTPLGAIIGGAAGATGFNQLNQLTGADAPTDPKQDLKGLEENVGIGALLSAVMKGGQKFTESAPDLANTLDRKSLGTRQSDYGKVSDTRTVETPSGDAQTFLKASLNDLLENGKLGVSRDPAKMTNVVQDNIGSLATKINDSIKSFDESSTTPVKPEFDNALQYILDGKVPADMIQSYVTRLDNIDKAIADNGDGKLSFLQKQKVAFGKSYDPADKVLSGFNRAVYNDLKTTIEKHVPEVSDLNAELAKYIVAEPIINRSLKASENASPLSKLGSLAYSTGGVGIPSVIGTVLGGPVGTAIGVGVGLTGKALASPSGQSLIARVLRGGAKADPVLSVLSDPLVAAAQAEATNVSSNKNSSRSIGDLANSVLSIPEANASENIGPVMQDAKDFNTKVVDVAKELDTDPAHLLQVMKFETGGELASDTKNKAGSGATGLIQFMPDTAKALTGADTKAAAIKILSDMTPTEQLDYVKKYLAPFKGKLNTLDDVYMAVLYPKAVGKNSDYALFEKDTTAYWQNAGLDINDDGIVTKAEASAKVRNFKV